MFLHNAYERCIYSFIKVPYVRLCCFTDDAHKLIPIEEPVLHAVPGHTLSLTTEGVKHKNLIVHGA
jgi:hypothetical protein